MVLGTVYEEARCVGIKFLTTFSLTGSGFGIGLSGGLAFDSTNPTAYSSLTELPVAENSLAPVRIDGSLASPGPVSKTGYLSWGARIPRQPSVSPAVSSAIVGGSWFALNDNTCIVGYLKPYLENGSVAGVVYHRTYVMFELEVRRRS